MHANEQYLRMSLEMVPSAHLVSRQKEEERDGKEVTWQLHSVKQGL